MKAVQDEKAPADTDKFAESLNTLLDDGNRLANEISKTLEGKPASVGAIAMFFLFENLKNAAPDVVELCSHIYRQSKINAEVEAQKAAMERMAAQASGQGPTVQ